MTKTIAILGSTGSVGRSTLKVIEAMPEGFEIVLLAANRSRDALLEQCLRWQPKVAAIGSETDAVWLRQRLDARATTVVQGERELCDAIAELEADLVVSAIVGAAGLKPTMRAIRAGSHIGLANKESMVVAGAFMSQAAAETGITLLPIDSEHNALHQCLRGERHEEVARLILTASGGPFRTYSGDMDAITPEQALKHPTWDMGPKISIDSATMMNKGLEVIEAHFLFDFAPEDIAIVVHPQSIVHSMIETVDGSYKCQLGRTDMCDPIQYALTWPERRPSPFEGLDITQGLELQFFPADRERFPCIQLAYDAAGGGPAAPTVLNAANEVAVASFLEHRIRFTDIPRINRACLDRLGHTKAANLDDLFAIDEQTRVAAKDILQKLNTVSNLE
ncbi:1-deoxy-D-xylulose-5-phosphate reductoisomerase [Sulfidibacter corallicola]|uniref:1-deoxy-D-xylulose 5-phosphate reductoisomerase n=1 Tax=Sulfidibacter corallicola TaxID=2818388 RepID=A0A8A4TSF1_SULCO|nr:1-deoxy-D-xylulose-5-phosphate reductoisomerase [Sulfidibacter corallicola]QTD51951.1 1-deoxy-D-xylulose-5-phosphate reductoisomerase [Sulfidibacter corallicola]